MHYFSTHGLWQPPAYVRTYNLHTNSPLANSSLNILSSSICSRHFRSCGCPASGSFADDIWRRQERERGSEMAWHSCSPAPSSHTDKAVPGTLCLSFTHIYMTHCVAEHTQQLLHSSLAAVCFRLRLPHHIHTATPEKRGNNLRVESGCSAKHVR